jgi:hypothetical protein
MTRESLRSRRGWRAASACACAVRATSDLVAHVVELRAVGVAEGFDEVMAVRGEGLGATAEQREGEQHGGSP